MSSFLHDVLYAVTTELLQSTRDIHYISRPLVTGDSKNLINIIIDSSH